MQFSLANCRSCTQAGEQDTTAPVVNSSPNLAYSADGFVHLLEADQRYKTG